MNVSDERILLGLTAGRPRGKAVWINLPDRLYHSYILGRTGTGKTTLLKSLVLQNARQGSGLCVLDPHGDLADELASELQGHEIIYWDVANPHAGQSFNPLKRIPERYRALAASGLLEALMHRWEKAWGNSQEHILRNCFLALLETPAATLSDILRIFNDHDFRNVTLSHVTNQRVLDFWQQEYAAYTARQKSEALKPIQTKIGAFLSDPLIQGIFEGKGPSLSFRKAMDEGKIVIINLAKGRLGADTSGLLGAMLVSTLGLAAFSRADTPESKRRPFFVYADEFQNFATKSFEIMLSELRKYKVGLVLANQYLAQLKPSLREAILGNCGTLITFRTGASDTSILTKEFQPTFKQIDLLSLPNFRVYIKMMIEGAPSQAFCMSALPEKLALLYSSNPFSRSQSSAP